jgi:hypothetical protein
MHWQRRSLNALRCFAMDVVSVDARSTLGWNMAQHWGFKPFSAGTQWLIVMRPAQTKREAWQPQLCRAYLRVEGGRAVGYVRDVAIRERVAIEDLLTRVASVAPGRPRHLSKKLLDSPLPGPGTGKYWVLFSPADGSYCPL